MSEWEDMKTCNLCGGVTDKIRLEQCRFTGCTLIAECDNDDCENWWWFEYKGIPIIQTREEVEK